MSVLSNFLINSFNPYDYLRRYALLVIIIVIIITIIFIIYVKNEFNNLLRYTQHEKIFEKVHGKSTIRNITINDKPRKYISNSYGKWLMSIIYKNI